jgi:hypothetical protein
MMLIEKRWVEGLATIPLYLATAFILNGFFKLEALGYVITILILLFVFGFLYRSFVVNRIRNGSNAWITLGQWCLGQILIIISAWYIGFIAISTST